MKSYYYLEEGKLRGPVNVDEMRWKGVTKEMLVWTEGMDDWQRIGNIPEIAGSLPAAEPAEEKPAGFTGYHRIAALEDKFALFFATIRQMAGRLWNSYVIFRHDFTQTLRHSSARLLFRLARFINL